MRLTPWEEERLLIFSAAELARRHRAAGLLLNAPEAIALMCDAMLEAARAGASYADVEAAGIAAVDPAQVLPGVRELVDDVRLEVLLGDGTRLIVLVDPLGRGPAPDAEGPGSIVPATKPDGSGEARRHRALDQVELDVENTSRRVVRVSSHFPFHLVNPRLQFDREHADGFHLDLDAGSSERWAPGERRRVTLVRYVGRSADGNPTP